jgi:hypothetical protein
VGPRRRNVFAPIGAVVLAAVPALIAWSINTGWSTQGAVTLGALYALPSLPMLVLLNSGVR